jgi:peroxiredoxin
MKLRNAKVIAILGALLSFNIQPLTAQPPQHHAAPTPVGTPDVVVPEEQRANALDFSLPDITGHAINLATHRGKVVLLDFWATWCGGCKVEIPWYVEFDQEYRKKGLAVIGVSMDDKGFLSSGPEHTRIASNIVRPFLAQMNIEYPVVIGNAKLANRYHLMQMPTTLLIDSKGKIAVIHTGVVDKAISNTSFERC